jgi:hypothetical protein
MVDKRKRLKEIQAELDKLWDKAVRNILYKDLIDLGLNESDKEKYYSMLKEVEELEED